MKLNLYDKDLNRISIIGERYISCLWSEGYNTIQPFTLELVASDEYKKKVRPDFYVGRDDRKTLMVIKSIEIKGNKITVSGKQAARVLDDVAYLGVIAPGAVIGEAISAAYADTTGYHNVTVSAGDLPDTYDKYIRNKHVLALCSTMCQAADMGFQAVRSGATVAVEFYKPEDRDDLVFSERFGNLALEHLIWSNEQEKNWIAVLGQRVNGERVRVDIDLSNGETRKEMIADARDLQQEDDETDDEYEQRLTARGYEKLQQQQKTFDVAFSPLGKDFGTRFDLGDFLTVNLTDIGIRLKARVVRFTQKAQQNRVETTIDVGTITVTKGERK